MTQNQKLIERNISVFFWNYPKKFFVSLFVQTFVLGRYFPSCMLRVRNKTMGISIQYSNASNLKLLEYPYCAAGDMQN